MAHNTDWNEKGCIVHISEKLTYKEIEMINCELTSNYSFDDIKYFIRDLTAVNSFEISEDELEYEAYINLGASLYKKRLKGAFVIKLKKVEDYVKFYIDTSKNIGNPWEQKIFSNFDDAFKWVNN